MKQMKKYINTTLFGILAALFLVSVSACSDGNHSRENSVKRGYFVTGKISLEGTGFQNTADRSATSSLTIPEGRTITVTAYKGNAKQFDVNNPIAGELSGSGAGISYSVKLPEPGDWYINVSYKTPQTDGSVQVEVLSGSAQIKIKEEEFIYNAGTITLAINPYTSNTTGSINLKIYDHTNTVQKVRFYGTKLQTTSGNEDSLTEPRSVDFSGDYEEGRSERMAEIKIDNVNPNAYEVTFNFENASGKVIYKCKEVISVFGGFTTDLWLQRAQNEGGHLVYDSSSKQTEFVITNDVLITQKQSKDLNTPVVLWNGIEEESEIYLPEVYNPQIYSVGDYHHLGGEIFGYDSEKDISEYPTLNLSGTPVFCFDDQEPTSVYVLEETVISKYSQSYSKYVKDMQVEYNLYDIISLKLEEDELDDQSLDSVSEAIAYCNKYLYFFFITEFDSNYTTYLGALDIDTEELVYVSVENESLYVSAMDVGLVGDENDLICCYLVQNFEGSYIYKLGLKFENNNLSLDSTIRSRINVKEKLEIPFARTYDDYNVSDIQILNNILYVTLYDNPYKEGGPYKNAWFNENGEYVHKAIMLSNGGVAKIDLTSQNFEFGNWKNNTKLLGWYTGTYFDGTSEHVEQQSVSMQAPLSESSNYLYGAKKFVARKPDELVIADDGGYIDLYLEDDQYANPKEVGECVNLNRIITVDLAEETFSVEYVNASFDATFDAGNETFYGFNR